MDQEIKQEVKVDEVQGNQSEEKNVTPVYAKKPHHRMESLDDTHHDLYKLRNILNIFFMIIAIIGVIAYLKMDNKNVGIIIIISGVVIKFIEASLRLFHK
jgi:hypothetical protein